MKTQGELKYRIHSDCRDRNNPYMLIKPENICTGPKGESADDNDDDNGDN